MDSVVWNHYDNNVYLLVSGRWYRFDNRRPPIGEGAMGLVYQGFECETNEMVAIKSIRPELTDNYGFRQRAKLEASIQIDHPNIIRMIGYCEVEPDKGPLFVVSEYVTGLTFDEYVRVNLKDMTSLQRTVVIIRGFLSVLDAVAELHECGVIHRDIKPENIMVQDGSVVKLMDLGVARSELFFDAHLCGFIGSRAYAAPEQFVEDEEEAKVDCRTDIYSLGITLCELLAIGKTVMPKTLKALIDKSINPDPELRFHDVSGMKEELQCVLFELGEKRFFNKKYIFFIILIFFLLLLVILI